jgi:hypothetical protein
MPVPSPWPLILKRFPANEYAVLQEVRDAAGYGASRSADGLVMGLWPSRGLHLQGIEVKSYRNDWLNELKKPQKAENIFQYCDRWWLVTAHEDVAKLDEIPINWGYMSVVRKKLVVLKEAPMLTPCEISRSFLAAILKRATGGMIPISSIEDKIVAAREEGQQKALLHQPQELRNLKYEVQELRQIVSDFESTSGVKMSRFESAKDIGTAVKFVLDGGIEPMQKDLTRMQASITNLKQKIDEEMKKLFPPN